MWDEEQGGKITLYKYHWIKQSRDVITAQLSLFLYVSDS
jgi:hypothetical protein